MTQPASPVIGTTQIWLRPEREREEEEEEEEEEEDLREREWRVI
jgi:hypothetical protein